MRVIFAGGGTGGHLMPALAVASALRREAPGTPIAFIGTDEGMEAAKAPAAGYSFHAVRGGPVKGVGFLRSVKGLISALLGVIDARGVLKKFKPGVVVCVGGYASFAAGLAAWMRRIPLVVLEQNAIPGRVNRFLSRFASVVAVPFDEAGKLLPAGRVENLGNPVRPELVERFNALRGDKPKDVFHLFVFGGSQGARRLNEAAKSFAETAAGKRDGGFRMTHQTGSAQYEEVAAFYRSRGIEVETAAFIEDMAAVYARTNLVFCRAGATSLAELTALGLPGVLVPYPFAADGHQKANAEILARAGAAEVIEDHLLDGRALAETVERLRKSPERLAAMAEAARGLGRPDAAFDIARRVLALGGAC